jgi:hypothetical protein
MQHRNNTVTRSFLFLMLALALAPWAAAGCRSAVNDFYNPLIRPPDCGTGGGAGSDGTASTGTGGTGGGTASCTAGGGGAH